MPKDFNRSDRVADAIQRILATVIPKEIRDPRLGMININSVDVARDLSIAKVYVTLVDKSNAADCNASVDILNRAANFLRKHVAGEISMRITPRLQFFFDESAVRGQTLSHLIDKAVAEDRAKRSADEE